MAEITDEEIAKHASVPVEELSAEDRQAIIDYINLPEDQKRTKKKVETKFVRCKLPEDHIEKLEELHPDKRCVGIRKAVGDYLYKHSGPEDTDLNRAWDALKAQFPETEGFEYFQGSKVIAKAMGIEESEAYALFDKLVREGYSKRIQTGDYVVFTSRIGTEMQMQEERKMLQMLEEVRGLMSG
ncbi:hypothetical protein KAR91_21805 [Candidatus Pacearchaeota archaeon]|nr:hypothetical protein [Candidatus Pacearchaeota archaeon]